MSIRGDLYMPTAHEMAESVVGRTWKAIDSDIPMVFRLRRKDRL
jgi:hypothetical protein